MSSMSIAAAGLADATARFEASARRTALIPLADPAAESVERIQAKVAVEANAAVLRSASDTTGTLLDMLV